MLKFCELFFYTSLDTKSLNISALKFIEEFFFRFLCDMPQYWATMLLLFFTFRSNSVTMHIFQFSYGSNSICLLRLLFIRYSAIFVFFFPVALFSLACYPFSFFTLQGRKYGQERSREATKREVEGKIREKYKKTAVLF